MHPRLAWSCRAGDPQQTRRESRPRPSDRGSSRGSCGRPHWRRIPAGIAPRGAQESTRTVAAAEDRPSGRHHRPGPRRERLALISTEQQAGVAMPAARRWPRTLALRKTGARSRPARGEITQPDYAAVASPVHLTALEATRTTRMDPVAGTARNIGRPVGKCCGVHAPSDRVHVHPKGTGRPGVFSTRAALDHPLHWSERP